MTSRSSPGCNRVSWHVLVEDTSGHSRCGCEHGWAVLIEADGYRFLFDAGRSDLLLRNAEVLGVDLRQAECLVISHGHYDHTGGIPGLLTLKPGLPVLMHSRALERKFHPEEGGGCRFIGAPAQTLSALREAEGSLRHCDRVFELVPGCFLTGEIPRGVSFEDTGGDFFLDESCTVADPLTDDQALWIRTPEGLIVFLGCAHSGVINTLMHIQTVSGEKRIRAVVGGMHLLRASNARIRKTVAYLRDLPVAQVFPGHCTGDTALSALKRSFGSACVRSASGLSGRYETGLPIVVSETTQGETK